MGTNRRQFIATTTLATLSLGLPNLLFPQQVANNNTLLAQKLQQAALKRRQGKFTQAKNLYNEVIAIKSDEIRAYDGLRKILLQSKYKELEVLNLYKTGMNQNPNSPIFKERVAKEYLRLGLGNKKFTQQLGLTENILQKSKNHFNQAKTSLPNNLQITEQIQKVNRKQNQNADTLDARKNVVVKNYKKNQRKEFKKRYKNVDVGILLTKLTQHLSKPQTTHRNKHIKELYYHIIKKYKKANDGFNAVQKAQSLYNRKTSDPYTLKIVRKTCRKFKDFTTLESIERQNNILKNNFWSKLALFDVLFQKYKKNQGGNIFELQSILLSLNPTPNKLPQYLEQKSREIKLAIYTTDNTKAFTELNNLGDRLRFVSSAHFIDRFNLLTARYFKRINDMNSLKLTFDVALRENNIVNSENAFIQKLIEINQNKNNTKTIHKERLLAFRNKLFNNTLID